MKVLKRQKKLSDIEECNIIREQLLLSQESENFSSLNEVENQVNIALIVETLQQVNNEWMLD